MPSPDSPGSRGLDFDTLTQQGEAASRPFDPAASAGLFVGVRHFSSEPWKDHAPLAEVPYAVDDAVDLAWLLALEMKPPLIAPEQVTLLLAGPPVKELSRERLELLKQRKATVRDADHSTVLRSVRSVAAQAGEAGLLVMSFATHGVSLDGDRLLCRDTTRADLDDLSLSLVKVHAMVSTSRCKRRLLLIDACREHLVQQRSVGDEPSTAPNTLHEAIRHIQGMAVLFGAQDGGFSFDDPERQNGVFTARVLEGLQGAAPADERGFITLKTLHPWLDKSIREWGKQRAQGSGGNAPKLGISYNLGNTEIEDLPLARREGFTPAQSSLPMVLVNPLAGLDRYLQASLTLYQSLPLIGVNPELKLTLGVDEVYVPLKGVRSRSIYKSDKWQGEHGPERVEEDIDLAQAFTCCEAKEAKHRKRGIVILGDPGSGKTTLLKLLLVRCIKEGGTALGLPADIVPVMLPLRDLKGDADLDTFFSRHLKENTHLNLSAEFPRALRESRPLLYLLDGLDEVPDEAERARVSRWIKSGLTSHTKAYFAVTCRYAGYQGEARLDDHFVELNVRPLKEPEAQALVKNFYRIVERHQHGDTHLAAVNAKERSEHLWGLLSGESFRTRRMRELQSNPLLLTIVCLVHQRYNTLPDERWRLYEQCVDTLLWHWQKAKKLEIPFRKLEDTRRLLLPLAWWLHQSVERRHATSAELVAAIQEPLSLLNVTPERLVQFLKDVRDRSGLLVGWSADSYGFIHLAFQEHLAALHLKNASHGNLGILDEAARHFGESWWTEVLLLLVSLPEPPLFEPFMRRVLAGDGFARQEHRQLLSDVVADASVRTPVPFLEVAGNPARSEEARYAALWAIRGMKEEQQAQVIAACRPLVQDSRSSLGALARGLLAERGVTVEEPLRAGSLWVHKATGLEFVYVPPGRFRMGSNDYDSEKPIHEVEFKRGFWIGKYPVTNAQYGQFMEETQHREPEIWQNREFNGLEQPVVGVTWHDAIAYTRWADGRLVEEDGYAPDGANRLHLPSEAEWEYAARGPESRKCPWGEGDPTPELANYGNKVGRTTPVGQYPKGASWVGALDLAGNVWEWCLDTWHDSYRGAPIDGSAWTAGGLVPSFWADEEKNPLNIRVLRGGSWDNAPVRLRGAYRSRRQAGYRSRSWGFRPVLLAPPGGDT